MAYRYGNRYQMSLMPKSIEDYVGEDNPVRAYDAFVNALDIQQLGIDINPNKVGNSEYNPHSMLKLLVYGYSYGVKSSRKLERECHHNMSFIWLMEGLKPDHKTIAEFRRRNKKALKKILRQCARMCIKLDLIAGNTFFVDGTKIRANAGRNNTHDQSYYKELLEKLDKRIEKLLSECEATDQSEADEASYVSMNKELVKKQKLKERINEALASFESSDLDRINQTDPDSAIMHSAQGSHSSYNVQSVVDDKEGLIVHAEATSDKNDFKQFARQIEQANELMGKPCKDACADAGYSDTDELEKIDTQGIKVIVPSQRQALHKGEKPFSKSYFVYDKNEDCYYCPEGHRLRYSYTNKENGKRQYRMADKKHCQSCQHFGICTKAERGRSVIRLRNEETKLKLEAQYDEPESQEIYRRRKMRVELPFGHIKRNLKTDSFMLRRKDGVEAETSILATCFNLARMIIIYGANKLTSILREHRLMPAC